MYDLNPLGRFSDRATDYARFRPAYAEAAIEKIVASSDRACPLIADIGAGTGISSRLLAQAGAEVIAIEPNAAMREAAASHPQVDYRQGQAEATHLANSHVDIVTCCQAFHWFEPDTSLQEFHRILRPQGHLALMWNDRDTTDDFTAAYDALIRRVTGDQYPNHEHRRSLDRVEHSPLFGELTHRQYAYRQPLTFAALLGRCRSSSYIPKTGQTYTNLVAGLESIFQQWVGANGQVEFAYQTHLYLTPKA